MASDAHDPLEPRGKPRVRAVFIGNAALEALRALGGDRSVIDGARCAFHISRPDGANADWARGVDVVVLGATREQRRTVLLHAAAAGVAHVVLLSADDNAERLTARCAPRSGSTETQPSSSKTRPTCSR